VSALPKDIADSCRARPRCARLASLRSDNTSPTTGMEGARDAPTLRGSRCARLHCPSNPIRGRMEPGVDTW